MATAARPPSASTAPSGNAAPADKAGAPIRVASPDQNGNFHLQVPRDAVSKVQIVDVDMVLLLKDGSKLVLAGGALGATDEGTFIDFSSGRDSASHLMEQVGKIELQRFDEPRVLNSEPVNSGEANGVGGNGELEAVTQLVSQAQTANAAVATLVNKALGQLANVVENNASSINDFRSDNQSAEKPLDRQLQVTVQERPGKTPQEFVIGPNEPAMDVHLVNTTGTTQVGDKLYGSGGSVELLSSTNDSNEAQIAPQVIRAGDDVHVIYATGKEPVSGNTPNDTFTKVLDIQISGDGKVQTLIVSGVPAGMTIENATPLGNGSYAVTVSPDVKDYALQLTYDTHAADPSAPIHGNIGTLVFTMTVSTADGLQTVTTMKQVVVKDASTAGDLSYANSAGESVFVLPAQGIDHIVYAGNNEGVTIYGSNANDQLYGGTGADTIYGGSGNTYFEGGAGADKLVGGNGGNNTAGYKASAAGVTVDLNAGTGSGGDAQGDTLVHIQNVIGSAHDDTFIVGADTRSVDGGAGGSDTISFAASAGAVTVDLNKGNGSGGYADKLTFTHIQNAIGSNASDAANTVGDTFIASAAANHLDGGSAGSDTVSYAASNAGVTVNLANGTGSGGYATGDTYTHIQNVIGSNFDDTFVGNADVNHFDGGASGKDTVSYAGSASGVTVDFYRGEGQGGDAEGDTYKSIENVVGSAFDDKFVVDTTSVGFNGGAGTDTLSYERALYGVTIDAAKNEGGLLTGVDGAGNNVYSSKNVYAGIEKFIGSDNNDTFIASNRADDFDGIGGTDTVDYSRDTVGVKVDLNGGTGGGAGSLAEGDVLQHIENAIGGSGNDTFIASDSANVFDGRGGVNTVDYSKSTTGGVIVDLSNSTGAGTSGGYAQGDTLIGIQNLIGSAFDDKFIASRDANAFDGGLSTAASHNEVSYANDTAGVTVDLVNGTGSGGLAAGDTYVNIQDVTGGSGNDTFIASGAANRLDGGGGVNTVSYAGSDDGVTVDFVLRSGSGGNAEGDTYANIQNVIGSTHDDTFIASSAANGFAGGGGNDTVSYAKASDGVGVNVDLHAGTGSGGFAQGDTYQGIRNVIGTDKDDTFTANDQANAFDGGLGSNTVSYAPSATGVTVDLVSNTGTGGDAQGDTYTNIQNVIGSAHDDTIVASAAANLIDGGTSAPGSHNRVDYSRSTAGVTVDLSQEDGSGTSGGYADGDVLKNIQDVTGSTHDDLFYASAAANDLVGGGGNDTVSYERANDGAGVTVDLMNGQGSGGFAAGDTYTGIRNVIGTAYDDKFIASGDANAFDGGISTAASHNEVSYAADTTGVTVDLIQGIGTGGLADGDTYTNIQDVTGGSGDDTFIANDAANKLDGGTSTAASHNRVSYASDTAGVTVDLFTGTGTGGRAEGDTYTRIQDATGGSGDDTFVASDAANNFDGGTSTAASHNLVSYANDAVGVTVDLLNGTGSGAGSLADGDTYTNIQDVTGGSGDDTFIANDAANKLDGGTSTAASHNLVSYASDTAGVTVDLFAGTGTGGLAEGDTYMNIQDVTGGSGDDTFVASDAANNFDGGTSTAASHNRVSYANDTTGVTVNLRTGTGTNGLAEGDTYTNIQDVTGGSGDDIFIASAAANRFDGGTSTAASHNLVSYAGSANNAALTINLSDKSVAGVNAGTGNGGDADGDTYANIQDATGAGDDDTFIASAASNRFDGSGGNNTVNYAASNTGVIVNLSAAAVTVGGVAVGAMQGGDVAAASYAAGDSYANIQNVVGSTFNDVFVGGAAANKFTGNGGSDTVSYASSATGVQVNLSNGTLEGVAALSGAGGDAAGDTYTGISNVTGSTSNDVFFAGTTAVGTFNGNGGAHDRISYGGFTANLVINLSETAQTVGGVTVAGGKGSVGKSGQDTYININDATGGSGNDTFIANAADNVFDGGAGSDTVDYRSSAQGVIVNLSTSTQGGVASMRGSGGYASNDTYVSIENVTGSNANDVFYANGAANTFDGVDNGANSHNLVSYAGSDNTNLLINLSDKSVSGVGAGTGNGGDANNDTYKNIQDVTGAGGNDTFIASLAANRFDGGAGNNTVSYAASSTAVNVDLKANTGSGGYAAGDTFVNIQNLIGSDGNDRLGGAAAGGSILTGGKGSDTLVGYGTNNTANYSTSGAGVTVNLLTGLGSNSDAQGDTYTGIQNAIGSNFNDTFVGSAEANRFDGGTGGNDTVSYAGSNAAVTADLSNGGTVGNAAGDTYVSIENLTGSSFDDILIGLLGGNSILTGGMGADTLIGHGQNNTASYLGSAAPVVIDLYNGNAVGSASNSEAYGDTLSGIQNLTGSNFDDLFLADGNRNVFDGAGGNNTVSYMHSNAGVTVNLATQTGTNGFADGDSYINIQNVTGSQYSDTFVASNVANHFDGGTGGSDTVSYAASNAAVSVDLYHHTGANGYADGDTYTNIRNVIGSTGNDTFYADANANTFTGGGGNDTVSYQYANADGNSNTTVIASLATGGTGGDANGDTYVNIANLTGSAYVDSQLTGNGGNNTLTALGATTTNVLTGGGGNDTFDGVAGGHNTMIGGAGNDVFKISADGTTTNATHIVSGGGNDTLEVHGAGNVISASAFSGVVDGAIDTLDLSQGAWTTVQFTYEDLVKLGGDDTLNIKLNNGEGFLITNTPGGASDHFVYFGGTSEYVFYDSNNVELGRVHLTYA